MTKFIVTALFLTTLFFGLASIIDAGETGLTKEGKKVIDAEIMEVTPVHWQGKPMIFCSKRPFQSKYDVNALSLTLLDPATGKYTPDFGVGHSLGCAYVERSDKGDAVFHVFAAEQPSMESWFQEIHHFSSSDLKSWKREIALKPENEHLLNSSVCQDDDGSYLMTYESNNPVHFCFKFARSRDLSSWEKIPDLYYAGPDGKSYSACPVIRRYAPYYYVIYLRNNGRGGYESALIRSKDLKRWEESPNNPILGASDGEGTNNSDVDLFEEDGKTWLYYATGDQLTWTDIRRASFDGDEREFFEAQFPEK